jgi:hypothetical protein
LEAGVESYEEVQGFHFVGCGGGGRHIGWRVGEEVVDEVCCCRRLNVGEDLVGFEVREMVLIWRGGRVRVVPCPWMVCPLVEGLRESIELTCSDIFTLKLAHHRDIYSSILAVGRVYTGIYSA